MSTRLWESALGRKRECIQKGFKENNWHIRPGIIAESLLVEAQIIRGLITVCGGPREIRQGPRGRHLRAFTTWGPNGGCRRRRMESCAEGPPFQEAATLDWGTQPGHGQDLENKYSTLTFLALSTLPLSLAWAGTNGKLETPGNRGQVERLEVSLEGQGADTSVERRGSRAGRTSQVKQLEKVNTNYNS